MDLRSFEVARSFSALDGAVAICTFALSEYCRPEYSASSGQCNRRRSGLCSTGADGAWLAVLDAARRLRLYNLDSMQVSLSSSICGLRETHKNRVSAPYFISKWLKFLVGIYVMQYELQHVFQYVAQTVPAQSPSLTRWLCRHSCTQGCQRSTECRQHLNSTLVAVFLP